MLPEVLDFNPFSLAPPEVYSFPELRKALI
jgi:hypothetical protein